MFTRNQSRFDVTAIPKLARASFRRTRDAERDFCDFADNLRRDDHRDDGFEGCVVGKEWNIVKFSTTRSLNPGPGDECVFDSVPCYVLDQEGSPRHSGEGRQMQHADQPRMGADSQGGHSCRG